MTVIHEPGAVEAVQGVGDGQPLAPFCRTEHASYLLLGQPHFAVLACGQQYLEGLVLSVPLVLGVVIPSLCDVVKMDGGIGGAYELVPAMNEPRSAQALDADKH